MKKMIILSLLLISSIGISQTGNIVKKSYKLESRLEIANALEKFPFWLDRINAFSLSFGAHIKVRKIEIDMEDRTRYDGFCDYEATVFLLSNTLGIPKQIDFEDSTASDSCPELSTSYD